jgi:hypothetical protein
VRNACCLVKSDQHRELAGAALSAVFAWDESLPYSNPANCERPMEEASAPSASYRYILQQPLAATQSPGA